MPRLAPWLTGFAVALLLASPGAALAEPWSRGRIARLPDSAFAVVEVTRDGRKLRHLPHHDETGAVDPAHLRAALARLPQVKWLDRASADVARRHLEAHRQALGLPPPGARRAPPRSTGPRVTVPRPPDRTVREKPTDVLHAPPAPSRRVGSR